MSSSQRTTSKAVQEFADKYGLEVGKTANNHHYVVVAGRKIFTSGTWGDKRGVLNFQAKVRRALRDAGLPD
jgi:hypothetical protein